jgi:glyoxylase-like metal-dependent hydrolase (beta-lactamase superfamily II)
LRAVSLTEDALLITSAFWQTNAVALRAGGEAILVDSPYLPDELDALPGLLAGAGYEPDGLIATHGDFDHLLGRIAYPGMALGVAQSTADRFRAAPGEPQRELRHYDQDFYIERPAPLSLGQVQALPVPGKLDLGNGADAIEIELHPAEGHTVDGMALFARSLGVLLVGDYVSSVEIPWIHGTLAEYRSTLKRLRSLAQAADVVVPGHGPAHTSSTALRLIDEDEAYLDALERGEEKPSLPAGRDSHSQRNIHRENLLKIGPG